MTDDEIGQFKQDHETARRAELREEMQHQRREDTSERAEFDAATEGVRGW